MLKFSLVYFFSIVIALSPSLQARAQDEQILAQGEGFEVTRYYVQAIEDFYNTMRFTSSKDQHLKMAIRTKVFSLEAKALGLESVALEINREFINSETVRNVSEVKNFIHELTWAEAYSQFLSGEYSIPDKVVESYYYTFWENFLEGPWKDDELRPLDKEISAKIKKQILNIQQKQIVDTAFQELTEKYGVVIHE